MNSIYFDNAATTPIDKEVADVMCQSMLSNFGNPSSTHQFGRKAKVAIENARKNIAKYFNIKAHEIIFTSGGTEADNLILYNAVTNLGVQTIVTSKIEHHAVLHTVKHLQKNYQIKVLYVSVDEFGTINLQHLEQILSKLDNKVLVSLMHINNEIGTILPVDNVCAICQKYNVLFHSDTVQTIGRYQLDLQKTPIDFITASAHKFHGPKGIGFAYFKNDFSAEPILHGGGQEKGIRSGTENVHAILGMEKALEIAYLNLKNYSDYILSLKKYFIKEVKKLSSNIQFNGLSSNCEKSTYSIINVRFPKKDTMLLFTLDLAGIAVSGGSACQSGSTRGSHVLSEILGTDVKNTSVRFSFSKYNTIEEINTTIIKIKELLF